MPETLLRLREAADRLNITYQRAAELVRQGLMPGVVRLGRQIRINPERLNEFIDAGGKALSGGWRKEPR
jgi:excisionase family DNA binding protein